jgi:hypothetical protein
LLFSLKKYITGSQFNPGTELNVNLLKRLYN